MNTTPNPNPNPDPNLTFTPTIQLSNVPTIYWPVNMKDALMCVLVVLTYGPVLRRIQSPRAVFLVLDHSSPYVRGIGETKQTSHRT